MASSTSSSRTRSSQRQRKSYRLDPLELKTLQDNFASIVGNFNTEEYGDYIYVGMEDFFRLVFERKGQLRLQEKGKEHYNDGHYNAIIKKISKGGRESHLWWIVTDTLEGIKQYERVKFAITSPVTYAGRKRTLYKRETDEHGNETGKIDRTAIGNARYLFAFAIDLDNVTDQNIRRIQREIADDIIPDPTFIVASGSGLHLYYCLEKPIRINQNSLALLNTLKGSLTRMLWRYGITTQKKALEQHDINQGYRFPGTQTKFERIVRGYIRPGEPKYYSASQLNAYVIKWYKQRPELFKEERILTPATTKYLDCGLAKSKLTRAEQRMLDSDMLLPAHWSLATARELFGEDWYNYVKEHGSKDWEFSENFYENWLSKLKHIDNVTIGHRYWCLWRLAAWAWNCKIPYARLERDAYDLMESFNELVNDENKLVPFTIRDCNAALAIYRERREEFKKTGVHRVIRVSRVKSVQMTGIPIASNKRNFRSMEQHAAYRVKRYQELHDVNLGGDGEEWRGRPTKQILISEWRDSHPDGTKYACAKDLSLDPKTVRKWWDNTIESGYVQNKRIAADILDVVPGSDKLGKDGISEMVYNSAAVFNSMIEEIIKISMGVPPEARPYVHIDPAMVKEIRDEIERSTDWNEELKTLDADLATMPEELRQLLAKQITDYGKNN